ncbi:M13 family metallopeptidase [Rhizosphaericola mali]|uniref:M13 family metallopeptidase n=1 Tax=Rhizosphaericola mali TaxID=2545455 RepID=A0A5P2G4Z8_9BACT|nr:M13 family metallopeptidase [Rhizosphaericola mali]QES89219.1 M13 family metallopeptidase [Rhizosphaericola mali]
MKIYISRLIIIGLSIAYLISCKTNETSNSDRKHFIETKNIDSSVKPGDDFFQYSNGSWLKNAKIPDEYSYTGIFLEADRTIKGHLKEILENAAQNDSKIGSISQKVGDFYTSGIDTVTINKRNYEPVKSLLAKIDAVKSIPEWMQIATEETVNTYNPNIYNTPNIFGFIVYADQKNNTKNIAWLLQAGIGLPERDYYFRTDTATIDIQNAYKNYLTELFRLTGSDSSTSIKNSETVYNIEKQLASSHKTAVQLRDVSANYHKISMEKIENEQPNIGWKAFFKTIGAKTDSVDMEQPEYYAKLNTMLKTVPIDDWKLYLKAHTLTSYANLLSKDFQDASFNYNKILSGQKKQRIRGERIVSNTDAELGDALGQLYVEKYFTPEAKQKIDELISNIVKAYANHIQNLDWMGDATKKTALEKLNAINRKIGFPDKWRDYSNVTIDKSKYFENNVACNRDNFDFMLSQLGKPVDKSLWGMTAPTYNAYYDPMHNDINFPAGILQSPLFDKDADDAVNYGGIGWVIGHEITHAFDDQGSLYDKEGNMKNWWTKEDKTKFNKKVKQIQKLYDGFAVFKDLNINGELTSGENIADLGGMSIAYDAFKMTKQGKSNEKIDGFTPDQRFFLAFANSRRVKKTDESLRQYVQTDPHATNNWRINGPLMNFEPFYKAFNVKPGEKMYKDPKDRIKIW